MASTYSPTLRIELIGDGDQSGIWGQTTNNNLGSLLEQSITGVVTILMTDANYTLTSYNGVVDEARNAVIVATGTNSTQRDIIPPLVEKVYTVKNSTTGGYAVRIIGATGTGVVIPNGATASVYCDGTNFYPLQVNTVGNQTINGNLLVTGTTTLQGALTATTATFSGAISSVSPTFTGVPVAPTAASGTSTTQIATTAFVANTVTGLGLGTMSTQNANNVNITGGTITGLTNLATTTFSASSATISGAMSAASATISGAVSAGSLAGGASTGSGASGTWNININGNAATASYLSGGWAAMPAGTRVMFAQAAAPTGWTQVTSDEANNRMLRVVASAGAGTGGSASPILNNVVPSHTHTFSVTSASGGVDHTHGISGSGTTSGQSANHTHSGTTGGQSADHQHYTSGTTGAMSANQNHSHGVSDPGHTHNFPIQNGFNANTFISITKSNEIQGYQNVSTSTTGISINSANVDHTHTWGAYSGGVTANHTHDVTTGGVSSDHSHTWSFSGTSAAASAYAHTHGVSGTTDNGSSQTNWAPRYIDMILCSKN